jgi:hypothetical protein
MKVKRLTTFSGVPVNLARRRSSCTQTPTGQVLEWHWRTMMQPMATARRADAELLGAQHGGDHDVAAGLEAAVGAQLHAVAQAIQGQHLIGFGKPHFPRHAGELDEVCGEAPVPPTWPETRITSALALATPAAMVPMPAARPASRRRARRG